MISFADGDPTTKTLFKHQGCKALTIDSGTENLYLLEHLDDETGDVLRVCNRKEDCSTLHHFERNDVVAIATDSLHGRLFWLSPEHIGRMDLDGTQQITQAINAEKPNDLTLDMNSAELVFLDRERVVYRSTFGKHG